MKSRNLPGGTHIGEATISAEFWFGVEILGRLREMSLAWLSGGREIDSKLPESPIMNPGGDGLGVTYGKSPLLRLPSSVSGELKFPNGSEGLGPTPLEASPP